MYKQVDDMKQLSNIYLNLEALSMSDLTNLCCSDPNSYGVSVVTSPFDS